MFALHVTSDTTAARLVQSGWPTHVVCATVVPQPCYGRAALCHVIMDDVIRPSPGAIVPSPQHVQQVLDFTHDLTSDDRLLVYCRHGRKTAPGAGTEPFIDQLHRPPIRVTRRAKSARYDRERAESHRTDQLINVTSMSSIAWL